MNRKIFARAILTMAGNCTGGFLLLSFFLCLNTAQAGDTWEMDRRAIRPGIWKSHQSRFAFAEKDDAFLVTRLRQMTGWQELNWTGDQLSPGDTSRIAGGSATAREIVQCVLHSGHRYLIESHHKSATVQFGQLDEGTIYSDEQKDIQLMIWRVRLDFDDFRVMQAPACVRASFDPGFTMIHELLHGLGHKDTAVVGDIGECEQIVNRIRAELGLLVRGQYHGELVRIGDLATAARLRFRGRRTGEGDRRPAPEKDYFVWFRPMLIRPEEGPASALSAAME
ncbi:MAG: hypothetical protein ACKV2V_17150 [Blastocatellia bacterium]